MSICADPHIDAPKELEELPDSQAKRWRHKCSACAYLLGRRHSAEAEQRHLDLIKALRMQVSALEMRLADRTSK